MIKCKSACEKFSILLLLSFLGGKIFAQLQDQLFPIEPSDIKIHGFVGKKMDACINNGIARISETYLTEPFKHRTESRLWQSEFWGKYVTSLTEAYRYTGNKRFLEKLDNAVNGLIATQSSDGYIGNYAPQHRLQEWDIWGMKYCMLGLLDYYRITKSAKTLSSVKKMAHYVIKAVKEKNIPFYKFGNYKGMAASSILEPMMQLYHITKEKTVLDFSKFIVQSWNDKDGPQLIKKALQNIPVGKRSPIPEQWYGPDNGQKAYEMMSCYEGLLELYRATGNAEYLKAVEMAANNISETEIMITGSGASMECWFGGAATQSTPVKHTMEACVTVTWMKLCLQILRITGDAKWANEIEKSYFNALLGTMQPDGSTWSKYIGFNGKRYLGEDQCGTNLNCCIANGPRGIMLLSREALMRSGNGVAVNFYAPSQTELRLHNGNKVKLNMETEYPKKGNIDITINPQKPTTFDLLLRIPDWAQKAKLYINETLTPIAKNNGYTKITRAWHKNDKVKLIFDMEIRLFKPETDPTLYALLYGPLVLASDKRYQPFPFYELYTPKTVNNKIPFEIMTAQKEEVLLELKIPFIKEVDGLVDKTDELTMIDFSSAGNTWDERSAYQVWMQKVRDVSKEK